MLLAEREYNDHELAMAFRTHMYCRAKATLAAPRLRFEVPPLPPATC